MFLDCGCRAPAKQEIHQPATHHYKTISTSELKNLIDSQTPVAILDARSGPWDDGNRLPGAKSLSYDATAEQAAAVINSKDSLVVVYCTNLQCPASKMLAERLIQLGYTNIVKYPEGIEKWMQEGNMVVSAQ